ncbi:LTA synthase family protein [Dysgonomonas sp. 25]|uniref:LTA synthase family protein n=1 Tax=Dysgonomonas sp. 25 TaxID=2302933 RepID=UPI0013CFB424|nr:alkaline phosphatase family protein [Dysgonomonas sp. 25]NDV69551.1 alkaline phosphatase family protein [Dysgonomonas sp. 25]
MNAKWNSFTKELGNLFFFWIFGVIFFTIFRIIFILIFHDEITTDVGVGGYLSVLGMGFKFDCTAVSYFIALPLLVLLISSMFNAFSLSRTVRRVFQCLFVILSVIICDVTINYYIEYNSQFNNFVFLGVDDDKAAVWKTIVEYYHPYLNIAIMLISIVAGILIFKLFEKRNVIGQFLGRINPRGVRIVLVVVLLGLFVSSTRGTIWGTIAIRKWASVSQDPFLNKTIINPFRSLKYAYDDYKALNFLEGENPFGKDDLSAKYGKMAVSEVIRKEAHGNSIDKPKQIFLVIMESYDSWPLMDKYRPFNLSTNLSRIADNGTHYENFLPSYNATFYAYGTITSGIPYCGINVSRIGTMNDPYITSIFNQFKKLGYKTCLYYGGFLSWENIGGFSSYHGCDVIYSGVDMGGKSDSGDWGVEDEKLFDLVLEKTNPEEYTLNVILTSSYHSPYSIDVCSKGFPYKSEDDLPAEVKEYYKSGMTINELGHLWYGDWAIGRFMKKAEADYPQALYAFTGDHYGRRFLNRIPNLYESSSVPFILYGNQIEKQKSSVPGSHVDIIPTLIEMVAPEGFTYYSFGQSMTSPGKNYGIGFEKAIDCDSLYFFPVPKDAPVVSINLQDMKENKQAVNKYQQQYKDMMQLAWYYTAKGDTIK